MGCLSGVNCEEACKLNEMWEEMKKKAKKDSFQGRLDVLNRRPNSKDAWRFVANVAGRARKKFLVIPRWNFLRSMNSRLVFGRRIVRRQRGWTGFRTR